MRDPVIAMDGFTYERSAIVEHMSRFPLPGMPVSPLTGAPLPSRALVPNRLAQDFIGHLFVAPII